MAVTIGIARSSLNASEVCGDAVQAWVDAERVVVAIADGLGHGGGAAVASSAAMAYVGGHLEERPEALFRGMHGALALTRGAAVGVAVVHPRAGELTYSAVGNTRAAIFGWRTTRLVGNSGIVGSGRCRPVEVCAPIRPGDSLVLWTDGLDELLTLTAEDEGNPTGMAERLLDKFASGKDDACVIVVRLDAS